MKAAKNKIDVLIETGANDFPLVVDLDSSLIQTDTLLESVLWLAKHKPHLFFIVPLMLMTRSRARFKEWIARHCDQNPLSFPYNKQVYFYIKRMARRGRTIILATGANEKIAKSVADHLGVFDQTFASTGRVNLVGSAKAKLLVKELGEKKFDYIGDARSDLAVWKHAHAAIVVSNSPKFVDRVKDTVRIEKVIPATSRSPLKNIIKALRVHQWVKNGLIFLPMFMAHKHENINIFIDSVWAFFAFSFTASIVYIINDLSDIESDRLHPDKKSRPFASGGLPLSSAAVLIPFLSIAAIFCAARLSLQFGLILGFYVILTNLYTFSLKRIAMADIIVLSILYSVRMAAGSIVTDVPISPWLITFTGAFFLSLAMIKRCSELLMMKEKGEKTTKGRGYSIEDLPIVLGFGTASGMGSVLVLTLYLNSEVARSQYRSVGLLWFICPVLLFWIARIWLLANRGKIHSDPVKFAISDAPSWAALFSVIAIWYAASYLAF